MSESKNVDVHNYHERHMAEKKRRSKMRKIFMDKVNYLKGRGEKFTITVTNGNYKLNSDLFKEKTYKKGVYTPSELNFIKAIRKHILSNDIQLLPQFEHQTLKSDIHYVDVALVPVGTLYEDVIEIDIDEAYWKTAHILGVIDDKLYDQGSTPYVKEYQMS